VAEALLADEAFADGRCGCEGDVEADRCAVFEDDDAVRA
jgi:hypothetical protein